MLILDIIMLILDSLFLKYEGRGEGWRDCGREVGGGWGSNSTSPPDKSTFKKPSFIRVKKVVFWNNSLLFADQLL